MKRFIAYFDYLGFKDFIMRNGQREQVRIMGNNLRDIENALALGKIVRQPDGGVIADLSQSTLKCVNFSDTVVIYSNDDSLQSLKEILDVSLFYCSHCNLMFFPVRGCVYYGEFTSWNFNQPNQRNGAYHVNSVFGNGLINAYLKAESQAWAGGVVDNTICEYLSNQGLNVAEYLAPFAKLYPIPYKDNAQNSLVSCLKRSLGMMKQENEWAIHLVTTNGALLNNIAYTNYKNNIIQNFGKHKKRTEGKKVQAMITNTVRFLKSYT